MVYELAKKDKRVVFIGSDLGAGLLDNFKKEMPERFFMEGISEANIVSMAAGLALSGKIVYVNTIATFITRRCFEQNVLDVGLHKAKVRLIGNGGGLVYAPLGPTHLAIDDIAIMRAIPNMTVIACADAIEMKKMMNESLDWPGPIYIRLAKGNDPVVTKGNFRIGKVFSYREGKDVLLMTTGITLQIALEASNKLADIGIKVGILHIPTLKPLDNKAVLREVIKYRIIISIEEHSQIGGLGSLMGELIAAANYKKAKIFAKIALPDEFPHGYGSQKELLIKYGINISMVIKTVNKLLKK